MDRWQNKVAVVTGASSGIGAATASDLVKAGLVVVALARREERLRENQKTLPENLRSRYHLLKCDVSKEDQVKTAFKWIDDNLGGTDILVNNAGILTKQITRLIDPDNSQPIQDVIDTNVMGVVYCVREAFNSMKKRQFDGHIIIVNSVLGHQVPLVPFSMNIYPPSKFAVTAMVETYRQEFANAGTKIKVTNISPGLVDTEIVMEEFRNVEVPFLKSEDVSNAILFAIGTPPHVQIHELIIRPVGEKY